MLLSLILVHIFVSNVAARETNPDRPTTLLTSFANVLRSVAFSSLSSKLLSSFEKTVQKIIYHSFFPSKCKDNFTVVNVCRKNVHICAKLLLLYLCFYLFILICTVMFLTNSKFTHFFFRAFQLNKRVCSTTIFIWPIKM